MYRRAAALGWELAASCWTGLTWPLRAAAAPRMPDRFFLGGTQDLRGFSTRGASPRAGGDLFWAAGLHLYTPWPMASWRQKLSMVRPHLFCTAGAVWPARSTRSILAMARANARASVGFGVSFAFGLFTIEANYSVPVRAMNGDRTDPGFALGVGFSML